MLYHPNKIIGLILNYKSGFWHLYLPILLFPLADLMVFCSSIFAICLNATSNADRMYSYHIYYAITLNLILFIGIIRTYPKLRTQFLKKFFTLLVIQYSLWGMSNVVYYPIKIHDIDNFKQVMSYINKNYRNDLICPNYNLYPNMLSYNIKLAQINGLTPLDIDITKKHNCIVVFSLTGDSWPYKRWELVNYAKKVQANCTIFGSFYVCKNI